MNELPKILILDNNREPKCYGSSNLVHWALKTAPEGTEVIVRRPPDHDLPTLEQMKKWNVGGIIVSGSVTSCLELNESWITPYDEFISQHIQRNTPMLGVCYGHQTIARSLFRLSNQEIKLRKAPNAEFGWVKINVHQSSAIFEGLPSEFITYESHYEEVFDVPPGAVALANTESCALQAYEVKGKPIFGIQFHPEYSIDDAEESLSEKLAAGVRKEWIKNPKKGVELYDDQVGKVIFGNFIKIAQNIA